MKTKLISLAFMLFICSVSFSQGLTFGVKGGATINKLTGKSFKEEFSFGYHVGAFATLGMGKKLSLQPEVLFNQVNQDTSSSFSSVYQFNRIDKVQLKYLSIPILLNYKASDFLSLQLGPQFGILMDQNAKLIQNGKDAFKKGDFSMLGGVQLKFSSIRIYGRYALGLSNLNDIDNQDKWKSQSFQIGVGLAIL